MSDQGQSALESALIGCFGGLFATFCVYPLDLAKSKVSAHIRRKDDKGPKVTSSEVLKKILAEKGAAGLYEGMGGRALQCFVEDFVFFWCVHRRSPTARQIAPPFPGRDLKKKVTNSWLNPTDDPRAAHTLSLRTSAGGTPPSRHTRRSA